MKNFGREDPPVTFDVAFQLKCRPEELPQHMLRTVGQEVKKDQMIAKKGEGQLSLQRLLLHLCQG